MKRIYFLSLVLLSICGVISLSGCNEACIDGQGQIVSVNRTVEKFSELELNIEADVEIGIASKTVMQIHAQPNVVKAITTKIKDGKLIIDASPCLNSVEPIRIKIFTSSLEEIEVNGSGMVKTTGPVTVGDIEFEVKGSGKIFADVYANKVEVEVKGSGEVVVNGTANKQDVEIKGSGNYRGFGLGTNDTKVEIDGSGKAEISAHNNLDAKINGSGGVVYAGSPKLKVKVNGTGKVTKME